MDNEMLIAAKNEISEHGFLNIDLDPSLDLFAEIERLKKEKSEVEIRLNKSLTEWKEKYQKREKLLDEEQTENNKLTQANEQLEEKIKELTKSKSTMPGE